MFSIFPYIGGSKSATLLARAIPARLLRRAGSRWRGTRRDIMINWGSQRVPNLGQGRTVNDPQAVARAANKIAAFRAMQGGRVRTPEWTTDHNIAQQWARDGHTVIVRNLVSSFEGRGIEIVQPRGQVPRAPLYTKYVKKRHEYRVHVMNGEIIDYAEKLKRRGGEHSLVRNTANGYIFARTGVTLPADVRVQALGAVRSIGLDFGAVDVVYNERRAEAYVLEVNTAPGIENSTLRSYVAGFLRHYQR